MPDDIHRGRGAGGSRLGDDVRGEPAGDMYALAPSSASARLADDEFRSSGPSRPEAATWVVRAASLSQSKAPSWSVET